MRTLVAACLLLFASAKLPASGFTDVTLASGIDGRLRLWDVSSPNPREIASVPRPGVQFQAIAFAPHDDLVDAAATGTEYLFNRSEPRIWV